MLIIVLIVLGLCFGSFINALVWRIREQEKPSKSNKARRDMSILRGRSMCPNCKHELAPADLIPLFSWLWLRGKCRYCHKPISRQYPVVELATTLLFAASYLYWPLNFNSNGVTFFVFWLVFLVGLVALAIYDLKWFLLPNRIVYPLMGLAIVQSLLAIFVFHGGYHELVRISTSFLGGGGIFWALFQISNGKWIGGGDVKLGMLFGLILADPFLALLTIFIASILGTLMVVPLLGLHKVKKDSRIPFGPLLIVGIIFVRLFGVAMINWYKAKLLLG